jgi:ABC-type Fe3+ transport system permease subunit
MNSLARSHGHGALGTLRLVRMPAIRGTILTVGMLAFVDCMKKTTTDDDLASL